MKFQLLKNSRWFKEWITPHEFHGHRIKKILWRAKTKFQNVIVADTHSFGRCLILDGEMQSSLLDEFIYHECLVHPPLITHAHPKSVLIMGGGEGATAREILKHKTVKEIIMVDLDGEVVDFSRKHLHPWHQGAFSNKKLTLVVDDAKGFLEKTPKKFDVIISDLPSPVKGSPANLLYTVEFFRDLKKKLNTNGIFVTQAGSTNLLQIDFHKILLSTLRKVFKSVRSYSAFIPSFDGPWGFLIATQGEDPLAFSAGQVDRIIKKRILAPLKFYDGASHAGIFNLPKHMRNLFAKEKRFISRKKMFYFC